MYLYKYRNRFLLAKEKLDFTQPLEPQLKEAYDICTDMTIPVSQLDEAALLRLQKQLPSRNLLTKPF